MKEGEEGVAGVRRVIPVMVAVMGLALLVGGARIASATHPGSPGVIPSHWAEACQTVGGFPAEPAEAGGGGVPVCPPRTTLVTVFKLVDGLGVVYSCCVPN